MRGTAGRNLPDRVNGNLFADWRDPAGPYYPSGSGGLAAGNLATSIARSLVYFSIYTGTETQTADTALSAILGAADTPAYKGIVYIVFRDFPVGEYMGIPKIEVEIGPQVATDTCSEYFEGTNGNPLSSTVIEDTGYYGGGATVSIYNNSLRHVAIAGIPDGYQHQYTTTFSFLGEFDFYLAYTLSGVVKIVRALDGTGGTDLRGGVRPGLEMTAPALELRDVRYPYPDGREALRGVSFSVATGECVGLIGPNGAGKSTLLLHVNGILPDRLDDAPSVFVDGDR